MLRSIILIAVILLSPQLFAEEQARFLSNNTFTYLHGGPGTKFRILGSVEAGRSITLLGEKQEGYSKIRDHKGREGWVPTKLVTAKKTFRVLVPELEARISELEKIVDESENKATEMTKDLSQKASQLERELSSQQTKLSQLQRAHEQAIAEKNSALAKLARIQDNQTFTLWREGGIIAGIGALVGIILVYLPRPGRRKSRMF